MGVYCCNICDNQLFKVSSETSAPEGAGDDSSYKYFTDYVVDSCNFNKEFQFGILSVIINCKGCYEQIGEITTKDGNDIYSITTDSIKLVESANEETYETTAEYQLTDKVDEELRERYRKVFDMKTATSTLSNDSEAPNMTTTTTTTTTQQSQQLPPQQPRPAVSKQQGKPSSMKKPTTSRSSGAAAKHKFKKRVRINEEAGTTEEGEEEDNNTDQVRDGTKWIGVDPLFYTSVGLFGLLYTSVSVARYIITNYY
ncbi:hypothetical protein PPL_10377 [Heterostelium album PN500]|uniref:Mis18 domain-containing protein n=1 Tax=Heterostelium pallidum (strain ATCC 26659 / Pp 5 / PN500) TaxID=670386 RepID=D3BQX4_HETP5|nr:hypothetical protein PPL_10377 [Heterostelium album PN500]EFA76160.1 hypothetical protein PPL_10377 [Heterostelium album PN500]|eukprot:XP_020428294.1 hypothetical protein PPL_10377 [Heterostelium album PN500]